MNKAPQKIVLGVTHAGSLQLLRGLPEKLVDDGWDVHIIADYGPQMEIYEDTPITVHAIEMARKPSPLADLRALRSWIVLLRELTPELVLVGTPKASLLGLIGSWVSKVPHRIYHLRGLRMESIKGLARIVYWLLEKLAFLLSTQAIAVSNSLRQRVIELKLVPARKIVVLGSGSSNGVDIAHFNPNSERTISSHEVGLRDGIPTIGFVGRITKDKGSHELAEASRLLHQRQVSHQLLVVGPSEDDGVGEIVSRLGAGNEPIFTGSVIDTAPYYQLMDLFCLPTHREGFPNVVLEAGASGIATVTTNATGAVDSVIDEITGQISNVGDGEGLADILERLLADPQKRKQLGLAARRHIEINFTRETVQKEIKSFLANIRDEPNQ